ncbi:MAG: DUF2284 domain-containing protein [Promethearchaeota archaeon]
MRGLKFFIKPLRFSEIIFDSNVFSYCKNEKFTCPNYGHSWACPPASTSLEKELSQFKRFYLIGVSLNLNKYIQVIRKKFPKKTKERLINELYRKKTLERELNNFIIAFLEKKKEKHEKYFLLWAESCDTCELEGKKCSYEENNPCCYPEKMKRGMTSAGINTVETVKKLGIDLNWDNEKYTYRFSLACFS